ncbi:MAG: endonuclease III [Candidatus Aenigmatarchaeota archaeon]
MLLKVLQQYYRKREGTAEMWSTPFKILVSCLLSQRSRDENTEVVARKLFAKADTPQEIAKMPIGKLQSLIRSSGTYRQKAKRLKEICRILIGQYRGKLPRTREHLMGLPGIGYKCADIILMNAFAVPAIAVDTHVFVVSKRLGLAPPAAKVEEVKQSLEKVFPKTKWKFINLGMVNFGREICIARKPLCVSGINCPFKSFCRAYRTKKFDVE